MPNVRLRLSYDGTDYGGFQMQKNAVTVQEKLEKALFKLYERRVKLIGAGRTDSGVHALGQAVSFHADPLIPVERIPWALNSFLPEDIVVWEAVEVSPDFHAARDAVSKIYSYTLDNAVFRQVLRRRYAWHCPYSLDLDLMQEGCRLLEGEHDFLAFKGSGSPSKNTIRTIYRAEVFKREDEEIIIIQVEGKSFLYKMMRFIAGALVELGRGALEPAKLQEALKGVKLRLGPALPAKGLCLQKVYYND